MSAPGPASQAQLTSTQHLTISKEEDHEHDHWRTSNGSAGSVRGESSFTVEPRRSLLDCAADLPQVLAERVRAILGTAEQVLVERSLRAQCLACRDLQGLIAFDLPDRAAGVEHLVNSFRRNEDDSVVVGEHNVATCDDVFAEASARERLGLLRIESHGACRAGSVAEEREADLAQLGRVTMEPPDDEGRNAGGLCLEYRQIADARLIRSARIVHDEDIARPRRPKRLEEDVDAAVMAGRECSPGDSCTGDNRCNPRRRHPQRHASP